MIDFDNPIDVRLAAEAVIGEDRVPHDVLVDIVRTYSYPKTLTEMKAYLEEHAGLLYNVGTILSDRKEPNEQEEYVLWEYLYENMNVLYDQLGRAIDYIEEQVFG